MSNLVNESLYAGLCDVYGDVTIRYAGRTGDYHRATEVKNGRVRVSYVLPPSGQRGETYALNCPFCSDTRKRCHVGYLFGLEDKETQSVNMFHWVCFNEQCQRDINNCKDLYYAVEPYIRFGVSQVEVTKRLKDGVKPFTMDLGDSEVIIRAVPGVLTDLPSITPGDRLYPVVNYLSNERRFDINKLDQMFGVKAIAEPYFDKRLSGRIYTPFFRCGHRVGWNARSVPGFSENGAEKYVNSTGGLVGVCYGLLAALETKVVIIVEGVTDKWATGVSSVAVLGKKLNGATIRRLATELSKFPPEVVVILLDPEKSADDIKYNRPHHSLVAKENIQKYWSGPVEIVMLPEEHDPSSFGGFNLSTFVSNELRNLGHVRAAEIVERTMRMSTATRE